MGKEETKLDAAIIQPAVCEIRKTEFFRLWEQLIGAGGTHETAYADLEAAHLRAFGVRKFKNFEAFRKARERRIRKMLA